MIEWLLVIGGVFLVLVLLILLYALLRTTTRVVSQERRLVIYRLGRFHRIAGPGPVQIMPKIDEVVRTIEVRDRPMEVTVEGIIAFGVPNSLTLDLWCRTDVVEAAKGDRDKLLNLAQISEAERTHQIEVKMREAITRQLAKVQERLPLPDKADFFQRLGALRPASARYDDLLKGIRYELETSLPTIGVILHKDQPIVLTRRGLSDDLIEAIKRRRGRDIDSEWLTHYAEQLRERFPDLSPTLMAQMLTSIEGVDVGKVQRLFLEQEKEGQSEVEFEIPADGSEDATPNFIAKKPMSRKQPSVQPRIDKQPIQKSRYLTERDLSVLKPVPKNNHHEKRSA